jgi:hypothetical protein
VFSRCGRLADVIRARARRLGRRAASKEPGSAPAPSTVDVANPHLSADHVRRCVGGQAAHPH